MTAAKGKMSSSSETAPHPIEAAAAKLSDLKLPEGGTTIDEGMSFEVVAVAHAAASEVAKEIIRRIEAAIGGVNPARLVFLDDEAAAAMAFHRVFGCQCEVLEKAFESARRLAEAGADALEGSPRRELAAPRGAVAGVAAGVAAAVNLLGLFEGTTAYAGRDVEVSQRALVLELVDQMRPLGIRFHWPGLGVIPSPAAAPGTARALERLGALAVSADQAQLAVHGLAVRVQELADNDSRLPAARLTLDRAHAANDGAVAILDELRESYFGAREGAVSPARLLLLAEDAMAELDRDGEDVYLLTARVEKAGGSYRVRRTLSQMVSRQDPLTFSGGVVVTFALLDRHGDLKTAGTLRQRAAYNNFSAAATTFGQERTRTQEATPAP